MTVRSMVGRHPLGFGLGAAVVVAVVAFGIYWFGPQYLLIDRRVDEALPVAEPAGEPAAAGSPSPVAGAAGGDAARGAQEAEARTLAQGEFRSLEHSSSGRALLVELADGSRFLRLEDLETSNGPDLRVILSSAPASDDWYVYDDGEFVDLGALKGNIGSSNYEIRKSVDLSKFVSAVVWCRRFSVGFAVAPLDPVG